MIHPSDRRDYYSAEAMASGCRAMDHSDLGLCMAGPIGSCHAQRDREREDGLCAEHGREEAR